MDEHELLLNEWSRRPRHIGRAFIKDGIIDKPRWSGTTEKVLLLLKEAYGGNGESWDLREHIRTYGVTGTWKKAAWWCYAAHHAMRGVALPPFDDGDATRAAAEECFLSSAIVNVKKSDGKNPSDDEDVASYVRSDGDLICRQVELINPDIVISGNVWWCCKELWPEANRVYDLALLVGRRIFIDYWHFANHQFPNQLNYYTIGCLIQNVVRCRESAPPPHSSDRR